MHRPLRAADSGNGPGRRFGRGLQRTQRPGGNGPGLDGQRRGAARADGGRSVAVAPDAGAVHGKASPGPGCGRQGVTRAANSKRRRSVLRLRRFYAFQALAASGLVWPRGRFDVGGGAWPRPRPPPQKALLRRRGAPDTFSRIRGRPGGSSGPLTGPEQF